MDSIELDDTKELILKCVAQLRKPGSVIILPTETVYGLVCRWGDDIARQRIYTLKERDGAKPFQMMISAVDQLEQFNVNVFDSARKVTQAFCPGPITILVPHENAKVGYRIPDHAFFLAVLEELGEPIAATSANLSGDPLALTVTDATARLNGQPDMVVDGGTLPDNAMASTVVDLTPDSFSIIRQGPVTEDEIRNVIEESE